MSPTAPSNQGEPRARHFQIGGHTFEAPRLAAGLYVVATPIGHLRDITLRALDILAGCDLIACEDTRVTRKFVTHYGFDTPLTPYHDHNADLARPKLIARIENGEAVALVSDAGTPLVSDPGYKLVRAAQDAGLFVTAAPGPSAALAALALAGLPTDRFYFEGFLPSKEGARRARIAKLASVPATLVLFETGPRLAAALADLAAGLGPRPAAVCRELTKMFEEARRGDLATLARAYEGQDAPKGEIVMVIAPPTEEAKEESFDDMLLAALGRLSLKDAVSEIASVTGAPRRAVYQRALDLQGDSDGR